MSIIVFEHSDLTGSDRLGEVLRDHGHRLDVVRLHDGDTVPADLVDVDGVLTVGGPQSANDDSIEWLQAEIDLLKAAHDGGLPVVGICLGSQILARALGGTVAPLDGGIELGWQPVKLTPAGRENPLHCGIAWESLQAHWHRDEVTELPPGAQRLSSSPRCANQAWCLGLRTYGFQYHPELFADTLERWADDEPKALTEAGISREQLVQQTATNYPVCARLADRLFESIALFLMPVDRRYQGVVKDLHH
jgi:GMP synthase-like glutamine amidotransferase